jgi:hypothetical protein
LKAVNGSEERQAEFEDVGLRPFEFDLMI